MFAALRNSAKRSPTVGAAFGGFRQDSNSAVTKTAVLMLNMGDSSHKEDVELFLKRVFTDNDIMSMPFQSILGPLIARRRAPKLAEKYKELEGSSTLLQWTELQGRQITNTLDNISPKTGPHKYYIGFRYTNPLTEDSLEQIEKDGVERVVAFSQYPQYSCCTSGSSLNAIFRFYNEKKRKSAARWSFIDRWPIHDAITKGYASIIKEELKKFPEEIRDQVVILFSAHSLPMKVVDKGDPYPTEVAATVVGVMNELNNSHPYRLVWQSKVGPLPWLKPETEASMCALARKGHRHQLLVPVAFVNEHIETLHEMDLELGRDVAPKIGLLNFRRAPALNDHPAFIQGLAALVKGHLESGQKCSPQLLLTCPMCDKRICKDMREWVASLP